MVSLLQRTWWAAALVGCLAAVVPLRGGQRGIDDPAGLFSVSSTEEANLRIEELWQRTQKDLRIDVIPKLPDEQLRLHPARGKVPAEKVKFWRSLAEQRAEELGIDGVYVLLCQDPRYHMVVAWPRKENDPLFPDKDRAQLNKLFGTIRETRMAWLARFIPNPRQDRVDRDRVLLDAVDLVENSLTTHLREQAGLPLPYAFHWTAILWAIGILIFCWIILGLVRTRLALRPGDPSTSLAVAGALPGNAYGAALGLWLARTLFTRQVCAPLPAAAPSDALSSSQAGPMQSQPEAGEELGPIP